MAVARPNWLTTLEYLRQTLERDLETLEEKMGKFPSQEALSQVVDWYIANKEEEKSFTILIIGQTGSGKSTLVNNLLGEQVAKVGYGVKSQTSTIKEYSYAIQGIPITLYDTPGLQDSRNKEMEKRVLEEIKSKIKGKPISLIIFCFKITETRILPQTVEDFKKYHDIGIPWKKAIVALTFADRLTKEDGPLEQHVKMWKDSIINDILVKEVGITPHTAHPIAFCPTTKRPDVPLPGKKDWFIPLWFTVLEGLDPRAMMDFLMIHNKKLKDSQKIVQMEGNPGVYTLEFIKQRYEKTFSIRIARLLMNTAKTLVGLL